MIALIFALGSLHAETLTLKRLRIPVDESRPVSIEIDAPVTISSSDSTGELGFFVLHRFVTDQAGSRLTDARAASEVIPKWKDLKSAYQSLARRLAHSSERPGVRTAAESALNDKEWQTGQESYGHLSRHLASLLEKLEKPITRSRGPVHPTLVRIARGRDYLVPPRWSAREDIRLIALPDAVSVER